MGLLKPANDKASKPSLILAAVFWTLVGIFVVIASAMAIAGASPAFRKYVGFPFIASSGAASFSLSVALIVLTLKEKLEGKLQKFLILTGASAAGFPVSVFLHNTFYGLGVMAEHITVLRYLMEVLHIAFFILAIFICPVGFLVGAGGSAVLLLKRKKKR